ncbi:MAG: hypothetical protein GY940_17775 [bacterium]|nr:hypothetical protein [bacterium]
MSDYLLLFREPPPRPIPTAVIRAATQRYRILQKYIGIALTCFGGFYLPVFVILSAPTELFLAFGIAPVTGIGLLTARAIGKRRTGELLKEGIYAEGELTGLAKPGDGETTVPTSYEMTYQFKDMAGKPCKGGTWFQWRKELQDLNTGDRIPVCYHPSNPRRNVALIILPPSAFEVSVDSYN